jgi:hypothetical protein
MHGRLISTTRHTVELDRQQDESLGFESTSSVKGLLRWDQDTTTKESTRNKNQIGYPARKRPDTATANAPTVMRRAEIHAGRYIG